MAVTSAVNHHRWVGSDGEDGMKDTQQESCEHGEGQYAKNGIAPLAENVCALGQDRRSCPVSDVSRRISTQCVALGSQAICTAARAAQFRRTSASHVARGRCTKCREKTAAVKPSVRYLETM